jgi:hypothetical protein
MNRHRISILLGPKIIIPSLFGQNVVDPHIWIDEQIRPDKRLDYFFWMSFT